MIAARPHISSLDLWRGHERRVMAAFTLALEKLVQEEDLPEDENALNRRLYFCLLQAIRELHPDGSFPSPPEYECNNQPDVDDKERSKREHKRPDFQWGYVDHLADPQKSARHYVLECKRLGEPVRSDWILNQNYINHGVVRFIEESHGYGKSCASGAMIGYIQTMEPDDILAEINATCVNSSLPEITVCASGWVASGVSRLEHAFARSFCESPFALRHLWADLRNSYSKRNAR